MPAGERNFSLEEIEDCRPILLRQILAVNPRIILAFGALAAQTLLRSKKTISDLRGQLYTLRLNDREIALVPIFNPAYLLRVPEKKREAWEDLKLAREILRS
ncbi:MAG: uracil-DNA glycosylase [Acidobacteria bacterium]|nr:uracil-DNA glycosylase [Acidobacteriota bacterium]